MVTTEYTGICVFKAGLEDLSDITRGQGAPTVTSSWERQRVDCSQSSGRGSDPQHFQSLLPLGFLPAGLQTCERGSACRFKP